MIVTNRLAHQPCRPGRRYNKNMLRDLRPLFGYMRRYRWGYVWGSLCVVGTNAVCVLFPKVLERAIDGLEQRHYAPEAFSCFAGPLVAIALVKGVFLYAQRWILIGISREIEFDLRNDLFRHLEQQDSGFYQRYRTGDIMARMTNDLNAVRMLLGPALMYSANTVFFTVGALFFLLHISPWLTLVAFAPTPLASILIQYLGPQDSRPLRAHPGQLLRDLRAGPGELLRRAPRPRLRPRRIADRPLRDASTASTSRAPCAWSSSWACCGPRSNSSSASP